jgi:S1-C subfamily serine protease
VRPAATAAPAAGFSDVVKKDLPAVVNISTSKVVKTGADAEGSPFNDPMFRAFSASRAQRVRAARKSTLSGRELSSAKTATY